jgi:hypothetical protein
MMTVAAHYSVQHKEFVDMGRGTSIAPNDLLRRVLLTGTIKKPSSECSSTHEDSKVRSNLSTARKAARRRSSDRIQMRRTTKLVRLVSHQSALEKIEKARSDTRQTTLTDDRFEGYLTICAAPLE